MAAGDAKGEALRAVFARLGFDIDTAVIQRADAAFTGLLKKVASGAAVWRSFSSSIKLVQDQIAAGTEIRVLADQFGVTTDEIQKYKWAAEQAGLSTQQMVTAFKILENHVGASATLTGMQHGIKMFGQYGLSTRDAKGELKGFPEMLGDVADKMSKMGSSAQRIRFANEMMGEMGFRLIPQLSKGREAIEAMFKDFDKLNLTMSEDFVNAAFITGQKLKTLKTAFQVWKSEIALGVFPAVKWLTDKLTLLSSAATQLARETTWMTTAWMAFGAVGVIAIVQLAGGLKNLWMIFSRFMWPVLIFTLLYLIFDDLFNLVTGGKSLVGDLLNELYGAGTAEKVAGQLRDTWKQVTGVFTTLKPILTEVFGVLAKAAVDAIPALIEGFVFLVRLIGAAVTLFSTFVTALVKTGEAFVKVRNNGGSLTDAMFGREGAQGSLFAPNGEAGGIIETNLDKIFSRDYWGGSMKPEYASRPGKLGGGPGVVVNQTQGPRTVKIEVSGVRDPQEAMDIAKEESSRWFEDDTNEAASQAALYGGI